MKDGVLEVSAIAWLVGPLLFFAVSPDVTMSTVLIWTLGLAVFGVAIARRHPAGTARHGWLAGIGWTLIIFALAAYTWTEAVKVEGGELGAFFVLVILILPLWIIGLLSVRSVVKHARRTVAT